MTRLTIAPADQVTGLEMFDRVTGSSPEKREARDRLLREQCIRAINSGDTYGWPPALVAECRTIIAEQEPLTEVEHIAPGKIAA